MKLAMQSFQNGLLSSIAFLWPLFLFILSSPFIIARLGYDLYGIWTLASTVTGMLGALNLGVGEATVKYVAEHFSRGELRALNNVVGLTTLFHIGIGLLGAGLLFIATPWLSEGVFHVEPRNLDVARQAFYLGSLGFFFLMASNAVKSIPAALQRYDWISALELAIGTLTTVCNVTLLYLGYSLVSLLIANLILNMLGSIAYALVSYHLIPGLRLRPAFNRDAMRLVFGFSFYTAIMNVGGQFVKQIDRLFVGRFVGVEGLTYYAMPDNIAIRIHGLLSTGARFLFPMTSSLAALNQTQRLYRIYLLVSKGVMLTATTMALPLALGARPLLQLWLGTEFAVHSTLVLQIQAGSYFLLSTTIVPYYILNGIGRPKINAFFNILMIISLTILCSVLVPQYGLLGAAASFAIYYFIACWAYLFIVHRLVFDRPFRDIWKEYLPIIAAAIAVFAIDKAFGHIGEATSWIGFLFKAFSYGMVVALIGLWIDQLIGLDGSLWQVGMNVLSDVRRAQKITVI